MAGRGCNITIQVLRGGGNVESISLAVALHTPLSVLKDQLEKMINIPVHLQVLILCDFTDVNRNNDILLSEDEQSLRACGIQEGSVLTVHHLVNSSSTVSNDNNNADSSGIISSTLPKDHYILSTDIDARYADHSYNGLIFDIRAQGSFEVEIHAICLAGMLGRIVCCVLYILYIIPYM